MKVRFFLLHSLPGEFRRLMGGWSQSYTDPYFHCLNALGTLPASQFSDAPSSISATRLPAILRLQRTPFPHTLPGLFSSGLLESTKHLGVTDIVGIHLHSPRHHSTRNAGSLC